MPGARTIRQGIRPLRFLRRLWSNLAISYRVNPQTGALTNYQTYNRLGLPTKRMDLVGGAHGGVPTPHVHVAKYRKNPKTGESFPDMKGPVRPAFPSEIP